MGGQGPRFLQSAWSPHRAIEPHPRSFKPLIDKAGVPEIRFDDLRHTAATICLRKKVPPKIVSEMLGHSRIAVTMDTYSHVLPDMQREATAAMEAALWG